MTLLLQSSLVDIIVVVNLAIGSLSTRVFETRTATGSELFSLLTCLDTTTFTFLSIFSPLEMISIRIWETPLSCHVKCSLPVAVRISKTRVLKLPNKGKQPPSFGRKRESRHRVNLRMCLLVADGV